jgi:hypothetical protein
MGVGELSKQGKLTEGRVRSWDSWVLEEIWDRRLKALAAARWGEGRVGERLGEAWEDERREDWGDLHTTKKDYLQQIQ